MQLKLFPWYKHLYRACAIVITAFSLSIAQGETLKKNKLVEFKGFGEWEIWCIDMAQSGHIECNLNQVLRYKNHPDFRAMIIRFYTDGETVTRALIDREWQSSFSRAFIQVDQHEENSLTDCARPCMLENQGLVRILDQFSTGENANIRFHDYLVEEFDVKIELKNFPQALKSLKELQMKY